MEGSPVRVRNKVPVTPMKSARSRCLKTSKASSPRACFWAYTWMRPVTSLRSTNWDLPMSRWAVMRPAMRTGAPSGRVPLSKAWRAAPQPMPGVNLLRKGSMPRACSAASLALRCSTNAFVSSMCDGPHPSTAAMAA